MAIRLSRLVADVLWRLGAESARVAKINLQTCYSNLDENEIEQLVRHSLFHMLLLYFEFGQLLHWPVNTLLEQIRTVEGESELQAAINCEQGVLLLVPHFGNWELLSTYIGANYAMAALYDPPKISGLESTIVAARERLRTQMFPISTAGIRGLLKFLKKGGLVAILPDQVPSREAGVYANFFGQSTLTMILPHRIIQRTAPVVMMCSIQRTFEAQTWCYDFSFKELQGLNDSEDASETATIINSEVEAIIRKAPEQYQWSYKRFKRPQHGGKDNIYRRQ